MLIVYFNKISFKKSMIIKLNINNYLYILKKYYTKLLNIK
jgi:hypothetical protein